MKPRPRRSPWVDKGIAAHGVPQRLLSDNGLALNPTRRRPQRPTRHPPRPARRRADHRQALQAHHPGQRTNASTKPCSAGSTPNHWPTASSSSRPRSTPSTGSTTPNAHTKPYPAGSPRRRAYQATAKADPPRPKPDRPMPRPAPTKRHTPPQLPTDLPAGTVVRKSEQLGDLQPQQRHLPRRRPPSLRTRPRPTRRQHDHRHRPQRRNPPPNQPPHSRRPARRQDPRLATPTTVTEVLIHQPSPMS